MTNDQNIIRMANDIAINLQAYGEQEAISSIAEHINKFWSPALRERFFELFNENPMAFNWHIAQARAYIRCSVYNPIKSEFKDKNGTGG
jgi:hypothetical protein